MSDVPVYKKKDFTSSQDVRWCPGCGDYSVLSAVQLACTRFGRKKEDIVFISGIGCSSRFPYYMNTYGMHSIHGRAPAIATGVKIQNPNLSVWVITGDGDALSIGGNHFIHAIRRNVSLKVILFNNEIYGLTKGQYSPTSKTGIKTKSSPYGSIDRSFSPAAVALSCGATFFARTIDTDPKHMQDIFVKAEEHKGIAVIEVLQNCVIFNDGVHEKITNKETRSENNLMLQHGKQMIFGANNDKVIVMNGANAEVANLADVKDEKTILTHDEKASMPFLSHLLASFALPDFPVPLGIFKDVEVTSYDEALHKQVADVTAKKGKGSVRDLLMSGDTWEVI